MRIFFSVGEPSGDLHGANLIRDLKARQPEIESTGFGGPKMQEQGCDLLFDLTALAVMGIWNVLKHVRKFFALLDQADEYLANHQVDAVVLIDYPGFNWWIARKARKHDIPVFYYGVPQMWAWLPWRVHKLRRLVDHVICKLPFEVPWFQERGCPATYVGHPYFDELDRYQMDQAFCQQRLASLTQDETRKHLVLLPGSRTQEVKRNLPWLIESAKQVQKQHPAIQVSISCLRESHADYTKSELAKLESGQHESIQVYSGKTPELILTSDACVACSGSVSLELLYHRKPTVIVYRVSAMVMMLQYLLLRTRFITLVNMLDQKHIEKSRTPHYDPNALPSAVAMPEYLRWRNCSSEISAWLDRWFGDPAALKQTQNQLNDLADKYAHPGASVAAAEFVLQKLSANRSTTRQAA